MNNLKTLFSAMMADDDATLDVHGQWRSDLPTFGGAIPADTQGVWSWDERSLLVGSCADDLEIVSRDDWA